MLVISVLVEDEEEENGQESVHWQEEESTKVAHQAEETGSNDCSKAHP